MSTSPKIAMVTPVFPPYRGGIGNVAYNQARVLGERGVEVTVFSPDYGLGIPKQDPDIRQDDVSVMPNLFRHLKIKPIIKYGNSAWVPDLAKRLKDFDVVILQYPFFGGMKAVYQAKKKYGFKLIVYYHMDVVAGGLKGLVFRYATRFFLPRIVKIVDVILASSEDYARHSTLGKFWQASNSKFQIILHGVDINKFAFSDAPREQMILFVGGLDKAHYFKGVEYLIRAVSMVCHSGASPAQRDEAIESNTGSYRPATRGSRMTEGFKLIIAGQGDLMEQYKKLAQDLGVGDRVEFVGGVSDEELVRLYQRALVTVLPSIDQSEAFGIVLVESMSCGTPVIASDLPGVRSVFENGVSGFTVAPRDVESLAERLQYALDNPEKMRGMGRAGRKLVEERYDWRGIGDELQKLVARNTISPKDIYVNCDVLENIPEPNRDNWLKEIDLLRLMLPQNARVLQVGSMDGTRAIRLLEARPDLKITGLEIKASLIELAKQNVAVAGLRADFICGDITDSLGLPRFDYVICLNNTLGYIPEQEKAIANMKKLGQVVIISVYGEKFHDNLAQMYFESIKLQIERIENNYFIMKDFSAVKRYSKKEVESWGGKITETPIGYFCVLGFQEN